MTNVPTFSSAVKDVADKLYSVSQEVLSGMNAEVDDSKFKILRNKSSCIHPIAFLVCLTELNPVVIIPLFEGINKIGRGEKADIIYDIKNKVIEAQQWEISLNAGEARIRDWYSSNESRIIPSKLVPSKLPSKLVTEKDIVDIKNFLYTNDGILIPHISIKSDWTEMKEFDCLIGIYSIFMFAYINICSNSNN